MDSPIWDANGEFDEEHNEARDAERDQPPVDQRQSVAAIAPIKVGKAAFSVSFGG